MNKFFAFLVLCTSVLWCTRNFANPNNLLPEFKYDSGFSPAFLKPIPFQEATGYYMKPNAAIVDPKITSSAAFNKLFGAKEGATPVDFSKQYIIAVKVTEPFNEVQFTGKKLLLDQQILTVSFQVKPKGKMLEIENNFFFLLVVENHYQGKIQFQQK